MAVYLAKQNNGAVLPSFTERKISNMMPGEVSEVIVTAYYIGDPNAHFMLSVENIQNFCDHVQSDTTGATGTFRNIFQRHRPEHMEVPTTSLFFDTLTDAQKAELQAYGLVPDTSRANAYSGTIRFENMAGISAIGPVEGRFVPGQITFDGALAYAYAVKGLDLFAYTSQTAHVTMMNILAKVKSEAKIEGENVTDVIVDAMQELHEVSSNQVTFNSEGAHNRYLIADIRQLINPSDTENVPSSFRPPSRLTLTTEEPGLLFPYFSGMMLPDKRFAFGVFSRIFSRSISDDPARGVKILGRIRSGFMSLAFTAAGRALSHAYLGVHMAMQSQSEITFLVEKGQYMGFVLQGSQMRIVYRNEILTPKPHSELIQQAKDVSPFSDVIEQIIALVEKCKDSKNKPKYKITKEDLQTSRRFVTFYASLTIEDFPDDFKTQLSNLMDKIYYSDKFAIPDQQMILDFLNFVATGAEEHIAKYPAYIGNCYYEATDRIHVGLGIFGDRAPSLNYGEKKDPAYSMPVDLGAVDPLLAKVGDANRPLHYLPFTILPVRKAADQWDNLFRFGVIHLPPGRKGKTEFTDSRKVVIQVGSEPHFTQMYKLIKEKSSITRKALSSSKKRRIGGDDDGSSKASRKKVRMEMESMAMDI